MAEETQVNPVIEAEEGATAPIVDDEAKKEPEEKGCVGKTKDQVTTFMDSKWGVTIMGLITMILAIVSFSGVLEGYNILNDNVQAISAVSDNWNTVPVSDMVVATFAAGCPANYSPFTQPGWAGANSMGCACPAFPQNGLDVSSSSTACNTNQTRGGCQDDIAIPAIPVTQFYGNYMLCARRQGTASTGRPEPTASEGCPANTVTCGGAAGATWDANRATCMPSADQCPVLMTGVWPSTQTTRTTLNNGTIVVPIPGEGLALYLFKTLPGTASFSSVGMGPVVDLHTALQESASSSSNGGVCKDGEVSSYDRVASTQFRAQPDYCSGRDPRYAALSGVAAGPLFTTAVNNATESPCTGSDTGARVTPFTNNGRCSSSDSRCEAIMSNTQCEKARAYAQNPASSLTNAQWSPNYRTEIFWSSDCPVPRADVEKNLDPITEARDLQFALVVVNGLFGSLSGILIPFLLIYNIWYGDVPCVPYEGQAEKNLIKFIKVWFSAASKIAKLIPLILVIVTLGGTLGFLDKLAGVGSEACSDTTTTDAFVTTSGILRKAYDSNTMQTVPMDVIGLLMAAFNIFRELTDGVALKDK